ncbi:MAG: T9SS type A sorting domain-containing protein [Chitinophagales bacterium]
MTRKFTLYTFLLFCICLFSTNIQAQNCIISPFVQVTDPPAGSIICANDPVTLSVPANGAIFGSPSPTAAIMWGVYYNEPTNTYPENDVEYTKAPLLDENGVVYGNGVSNIASTNIFLTDAFLDVVSLNLCIVPIITADPAVGPVIDPSCTGVVPGSSPVFCFTVQNPAQNSTCYGCAEEVAYDDCGTAANLADFNGVNGPYDNTCTTFDASTDIVSDACFGDDVTISTAWFSFTGNGNSFNISVLNCENSNNEQLNAAQVVLYSGNCNSLNEVDCATAVNDVATLNTLVSEADVTYYVMVDGLGENKGEFCIDVEEIVNTTCEPIANPATVNNGNTICLGDDIDVIFNDDGLDDYTTDLVIVDANDIIISGPIDIGNYTAIVINFANVDSDIINNLLTVGLPFPTDFSAASCEPAQVSTPFSIEDCTLPCEPSIDSVTVNGGNEICEGDEILVSIVGNATNGYSTTTFFINEDNIIVDTPTSIGVYVATTVNFADADTDYIIGLLAIGNSFPTNFADASCEPATSNDTFTIVDCTTECAPNSGITTLNNGNTLCENEDVVVSVSGDATGDYITMIAIANNTNTIVASGENGLNEILAAGEYTILTVSFAVSESDNVVPFLAIDLELPTNFNTTDCPVVSDTQTIIVFPANSPECAGCSPNIGAMELITTADGFCLSSDGFINLTGENTDENYTSLIVVTDDANNIILSFSENEGFTLELGNYTATAINFANYDTDVITGLLEIGNQLPTDFSAALCTPDIASITFSVIECNVTTCDANVNFIEANAPLTICSTETTGIISVLSNSSTTEYSSSLIITQMGGDTIEGVAVSGNGISPSTFDLSAGTYCIHPINYLSSDWEAIDAVIGGSASLNDIISAIDNGIICAELDTELCVSMTVLEANDLACLELLDIINLQITPSDDNLTFTVSFTIVGGTGVYTVDNVEIEGNTFTSEAMPCDTFYGFNVSDSANSTNIIVEGTFACVEDCTSESGTMTGDFQLVCDTETLSFANNGDEILGDDEMLSYYLHTDENDVFGSSLGNNPSGTFDISSLNYNTDYYVSAVVGVADENGDIIEEHPCTVVSPNSDSFAKLAPITVTIDEDCDFVTGTYTVVAQFDGGLPAYDANAVYEIGGDFTGEAFVGVEITFMIEEGSTNIYQITASDGLCETLTASNSFYCEKTPIELISFTGEVQVRGNLLKWATASELDNDYFTIERSIDGHNFEAITFVSAEGSSLTTLRYEFLDKQAPNGQTYYRLLQTDFDGTTTSSETITLKRNEIGFSFNDIYPVPANDFVEVSFNVEEDVKTEIQIFNLAGSLITTYNEAAIKGTNSMTIDVSNYSTGVYFVTVNIGTDVISGRLIKN